MTINSSQTIKPSVFKKMLRILLILALTTYTIVDARPTDTNCTNEFQSLVEQALEVKSHCKIKGFYDCCEVRSKVILALYNRNFMFFKAHCMPQANNFFSCANAENMAVQMYDQTSSIVCIIGQTCSQTRPLAQLSKWSL